MSTTEGNFEVTGSEEDFLVRYEEEKQSYDKPSVTTDIIGLRFNKYYQVNAKGNTEDGTVAQVLMIRRGQHPYQGKLAFPGGFLAMDETLEECAKRELLEETGVNLPYTSIEQLGTYSAVNRDPRMRILTVPYLMYLPSNQEFKAGDDAREVELVNIGVDEGNRFYFYQADEEGQEVYRYEQDDFAFDHYGILTDACLRIRGRLTYKPTILNIFEGRGFTVREASAIYGCFDVRYQTMTQSNFKRTIQVFISDTGQKVERLKRPANIFTYGNTQE